MNPKNVDAFRGGETFNLTLSEKARQNLASWRTQSKKVQVTNMVYFFVTLISNGNHRLDQLGLQTHFQILEQNKKKSLSLIFIYELCLLAFKTLLISAVLKQNFDFG